MRNKYCVKCDGEMIDCYVDEGLKGILVKNPDGDKLFSNKKNTRINPSVCAECGSIEWFAENPQDLR